MKIVFFAHPLFLASQSMPRFVNMLAEGMKSRGHVVEIWRPEAMFSKLPFRKLKKWLGYIDQYLVFPQLAKRKIRKNGNDVLYVFSDHALGPYVPIVAKKPHVIHCHDFLAQRSARGEIAENITSATGRLYQAYIRRGYAKGANFISVSGKTRADLHEFLNRHPVHSEMVYNGLNRKFFPGNPASIRDILAKEFSIDLKAGYILHVGGNQWYKNRGGVIEIYNAWRLTSGNTLPLLLIGEKPDLPLMKLYNYSPFKTEIHLLSNVPDETVQLAYAGASVFLFPSLAEGFGWPIAEAMASGTPVITTNEAPMTEVAGSAAVLIAKRPAGKSDAIQWAADSAKALNTILAITSSKRQEFIEVGIANAARFDSESSLNQIEAIYKKLFPPTSKV